MLITPISQGQVYTAGAGIDIVDNVIGLTAAHEAIVAGAVQESTRNQALGFAGLNAQTGLDANVNVQYMTHDQANAQVVLQGRIIVISDTKALRFGDGVSQGGFVAGLGSENTLYVSPVGTTALENGQLLAAAYAIAKTMTPSNAALSATNRVTVLLGIGNYELPNFQYDASFIDVAGVTKNGVRCNFNLMEISSTNDDVQFRNMTFYKTSTNYSWVNRFTDIPRRITFEDVIIEGAATDVIFGTMSRTTGATSQITWTLRNVRTACSSLCWQPSGSLAGHTQNLDFDNVEGGNRFVSPSTVGTLMSVTGKVYRTKYLGTVAQHFNQVQPLRFWSCEWAVPMNYMATGTRLEYVRFTPVAGTPSLVGVAASQSCFVAHCSLAVFTHATLPIINTAGATDAAACNVRSDGV